MPIVEINGQARSVSAAFGQYRSCAFCGSQFVVTSITGRQLYCGERCKEKALWRRETLDPAIVAANRARCRSWASANRAVKGSNSWLLGAPPFGEYLPGGAFSLRITPPPKWPIELRNTRALHGLATSLIGKPHDTVAPGFVLIPTNTTPSGWAIYVPAPEDALRLAGRQHQGTLFDRDVLVTCTVTFVQRYALIMIKDLYVGTGV